MSTSKHSKRARYTQNDNPPQLSPDEIKEIRRSKLLRCIEHVVSKLVRSMMSGEPLTLRIPDRCWKNTVYDDCLKRKPRHELSLNQVKFGFKCSQEKFAVIIHVLSSIYLLVMRRETSTKRELYYQDKALYQNKQSKVDHTINDICCLLGTSPWDLGIMPTSKGLVAGPLRIITASDEDIDCRKQDGVLIPQNVQGIKSITSTAEVIIIIEKDAAFQKCIDEGVLNKPWLIITGKGVPDVNSRMFVNVLWKTLQIPVYALVDADPYGIEIMCTYRFGSLELAHLADKLATPAIKWMGVYPTDIENYIIPSVPLTLVDISKLKSLLARSYIQAFPRLQAEIQYMLDENKKAEMEAISSISTRYSVNVYIPNKLRAANLI